MTEFKFCLKTSLITLAIVLMMQIQVGQKSLEAHAMSFIQSSAVVAPLNAAAKGGAKLIGEARVKITQLYKRYKP